MKKKREAHDTLLLVFYLEEHRHPLFWQLKKIISKLWRSLKEAVYQLKQTELYYL